MNTKSLDVFCFPAMHKQYSPLSIVAKRACFILVSQGYSYSIISWASGVRKGEISSKGTSKVMMPEE